jgi:hypothetical protein
MQSMKITVSMYFFKPSFSYSSNPMMVMVSNASNILLVGQEVERWRRSSGS